MELDNQLSQQVEGNLLGSWLSMARNFVRSFISSQEHDYLQSISFPNIPMIRPTGLHDRSQHRWHRRTKVTHCCIKEGHRSMKDIANGFVVKIPRNKPRYRIHCNSAE